MEPLYPPYGGTERETLVGYLDWYRELMIDKASGLTGAQANARLMPSTLTLIGLIHHLAYVEHWWFHEFFEGSDALEPWASADWEKHPDWELTVASELEPSVVIERYRNAFEASQRIISETDSLEQLSVMDRNGEHRSLRWILAHMIEETARHAGHADLIRESIDGEVGDFRKPN
jgi:uncharacterized damage-inducible protein DinB